jgi:hypothetical protein
MKFNRTLFVRHFRAVFPNAHCARKKCHSNSVRFVLLIRRHFSVLTKIFIFLLPESEPPDPHSTLDKNWLALQRISVLRPNAAGALLFAAMVLIAPGKS